LPPPAWIDGISRGDILYTASEPVGTEMMASIGNGYVATVVGSDTLYATGVFNGELTNSTDVVRARIPSPLAVDVILNGPKLLLNDSALDLARGVYQRRLVTSSNDEVYVKYFSHRSNRSISMVVLEGVLNSTAPSIPVSLSQNMGSPSADINFSVKQIIITMPDGRRSNVTVSTGNTLTPELNGTNTTSVAVVSTAVPSTLSLLNGKPVPLITSIRSSLDSTDPMNDALLDYTFAFMAGPEALLQSHVEAWNQLWGSGFEITGRHDVALAVNSSLYYLLSSIRSDMPHSLSPGGLASNGYNGHTFWDCETWMYPSLLMWHPDIAQSLLQYRYDRREGARMKAASYSPPYKGTMFPWESAYAGTEACPTWASTGEFEQHISGPYR